MKRTDSNGFSAVLVILAFVIVGLIIGVGWYVYDANKEPGNNTQTPVSTQPANTDPDYLYIKEWGVRMKVDPSVAPVTYTYNAEYDSITMSSQLQKSLSEQCYFRTSNPWGASRLSTKEVKEKSYPEYNKEVGNYSYLRSYPQDGCEDSDAETMRKLDSGFNKTYESMELS